MLVRGFFVLLIALLISLLTGGSRHYSSDIVNSYHPDSLWAEWRDVSLRILKSEKLDALFGDLHKKRKFNGAVIVAEQGTILHAKSYGYANFRTRDSLSLQSSFQLASVSKIFTATAIMLLYEEGKLDFDDLVSDHLEGWPYEKMTIRHLLTHRSGLARYMAVASWYWKNWQNPLSNENVLDQYVQHKPIHFFNPGRGFNYCNTNYVILASLVEKVSGMSYDVFLKKRIFEPLNMENAMVYSRVTDPEIPNHAIGYKAGRRGYYKAWNDYIDGVWGDKNVFASVNDLYKFDQALYNNTLLKASTMEQAYTPGSKRRINNYGFGWRIKNWKEPVYYHFGWWRGYHTCFIRDVVNERTLIILSNKDHPGYNLGFWEIYQKIKNI